MRTPLALSALTLSLLLQPGCGKHQATPGTHADTGPGGAVFCNAGANSGPVADIDIQVRTPPSEAGPGDDEALAYFRSVLPVIAAYDGSDDWHARFIPLTHEEAWSYNDEEVDRTIGFTRGRAIREARFTRFTLEDGSPAWVGDIIYAFSDTELPVLLDVVIYYRAGAYHIRSVSRDMC